ncbi:conserved hypothetical protein [Nitrospina gracilis 3/211]|uniref:Lcl C-terminal domain-containing protein n=1 Tax=Nitrospina gracilis (strain 3/211) TaxID=1266370 RepID=M1YVQ6_NITG3|nr:MULTISPECIES: DUF1566 domain-containing protein [Nitrospina]MCF8722197.1 hypothetical protein [Nitrospina sp. Nb-3]CCQ89392.1 conserved hypothetical protein [Nitrospina gracilis 3/211]
MTERFVENEDGTVTDTATGLVWQQSYHYAETGNYCSWYEANEYIEHLNRVQLGGHADWRLPDRLELQSLYEIAHTFESRGRTYTLHIDPVFEFGYGSCFWTWRSRLSGALGFEFDAGNMHWYPKASFSGTVRAVRGNLNPFLLIQHHETNAHTA